MLIIGIVLIIFPCLTTIDSIWRLGRPEWGDLSLTIACWTAAYCLIGAYYGLE